MGTFCPFAFLFTLTEMVWLPFAYGKHSMPCLALELVIYQCIYEQIQTTVAYMYP